MNLAVIGSGGREHSICYKLKQSSKLKKLICIPGNAGTKNIAENITGGGKFKPDKKGGLIQTKSDLEAFKALFGEFKNANSIIANVTTDLAEIASRDRFYNVVKQGSDKLIKNGYKIVNLIEFPGH